MIPLRYEKQLDLLRHRSIQFLAWRGSRITIITTLGLLALTTIWLCSDLTKISRLSYGGPIRASSASTAHVFRDTPHLIPPKIWQIMLSKQGANPDDGVDPKAISDAPSWLSLNTDYSFTLVGNQGAHDFLHRHYANDPEIIKIFNDLVNTGMKSDLLRYLLLEVEGGVYADTDTIARRPIDDWVPEDMRDKVRAIVGIEYDRRKNSPVDTIPHFVQFCQWTIAAAPGHPVFRRMAKRIVASVKELTKKHGLPLDQIQPEYFDVLNTTGPPSWTSAVFEELQLFDPNLTDTKDFSYMTEPRLVGDILVLAIDGFGMGQGHSGSTHDGTIPEQALISHRFRGSWKEEEQS